MTKYEVLFYENENGECPVEEFVLSQDVKMYTKLVGLLNVLEEKGASLRDHIVSIWKMEFLNCVVKLALILPEYSIFSIVEEK